ncbi:lactonase family protein [Salegentibacter chungangensis]|uniref:Lactonase family protein n=1 Tax=Salegentibacter chungangensis TaxID=1335724 RepID=A0ABW3NV73_9FLAO
MKFPKLSISIIGALVLSSIVSCGQKTKRSESGKEIGTKAVYIGTYTKKEGHVDGKAEGIYLMQQNSETGALKILRTVAEVVNPSFVKVSPDNKNLYAVSELGPGDAESGFIYSFSIAEDNSLKELSKLPTGAFAPCHIGIDKTGKYIFVSNYVGGVVMMYERKDDGSLKTLQKISLEGDNSHAHSVSVSSNNKQAYVADLGSDKIWIFDLDEKKNKLVPHKQKFVELEEGAGPRHFSFGKNNEYAYSINELNNSVTVYKIRENGGLEIIQNISSLPADFSGESAAADIHLHPSGKYLYVSNRGHNSIASFSVEKNSGKLRALEYNSTKGKAPRNFAISPDGNYLYAANQDSGNITTYKIDNSNGTLRVLDEPVKVKTPVCIEFE